VLARATPEQFAAMIAKFGDESGDMDERMVLAHALVQSGNPAALEALQEKLRQPDAGLLMHRFASHGLAFCDAPGIEPFLTDMARNVPDRGVRANLAFGLNRRGVKEGADLYFAAADEAFAQGDPAALQYLGGLAIMGENARPGIRERLLTYTDEQALVVLIGIVKGSGDREAVPNLEKLAYDAARGAAVRKAAGAAIGALAAK
jgi:hypothetical protein